LWHYDPKVVGLFGHLKTVQFVPSKVGLIICCVTPTCELAPEKLVWKNSAKHGTQVVLIKKMAP
jgi:hypothetical protein